MEVIKIYYVYEHIRLDKNEVFYVGIGSKRLNKPAYSFYKRANAKDGRNNIWKKIVSKTNYEIKIVFESENLEEVFNKEIELIKFYGKIINNTGTLSNITDGGEGYFGYKPTAEVIENHRQRMLGRKASEETKKKMSKQQRGKYVDPEVGKKISAKKKGIKLKTIGDSRSVRILHIPTNRVFKSMGAAAKEFNYRDNFFRRCLKRGEFPDFKIITEEEFENILKETGQIIPKIIITKPFSEERKRKISEFHKGKVYSEESKRRMSIAQKGKIRSAEIKEILSLSSPNNVKIRNIITGEVFRSITQAALSKNMSCACLKGQLDSSYEFCEFEFMDKYNKPRKPIKIIRNKTTNKVIEIGEICEIENMTETAVNARLYRKSKTFNYYFDQIMLLDLHKEKLENDKLKENEGI